MAPSAFTTFGPLLKQLRKRAGMTQADLAAAVGYSIPFISNLELNQRLPDVQMVMQTFVPALGLQDEPQTAAHLIERAAVARRERPPVAITQQRVIQVRVQAEIEEQSAPLPTPPTELIGREMAINQLCNRLLGHSGRLLTLVGPPGIGKTTLALAVAARLHLHYRNGAVFVPLAAVSDPTLMAATILAAVGSTDVSPPQTKLIEVLRRKTMLLVLDNLEQIREAAPLIAGLVAECPGLCILATSRERLHLRAEQRHKVPPLELAAAVDLFVQRAQAVDADFILTLHNQPTLEAICQRLDCLPLALELYAAQIDLLSPVQLLTHLQTHRLDLLVEGAHDLPPRQRTLRTAIGHSYALLDNDERTLFRSLGVFVGGFTLDAVKAIAVDRLESPAVLHALIGKSLVRTETMPNGEPRFLLLETIREFALEQLRAHGEEERLRDRHYTAYLQLFRTGDSYLRGAKAATWFARLEPEQDNLRAAVRWTLDSARYEDATWLLIAAGWFWHQRGQWYESGKWRAQLLPHRQALPVALHLDTLISVYAIGRALEEFQPLNRWKGEILQLLAVCTDQHLHAAAWHFIAAYSVDFSEAATAWERAIVCARAARQAPTLGLEFCLLTDSDFILGNVLWAYAAALIEQGEFAQALPLLMESREIFQRRESRYEMTDSFGALGRLAFLQGDMLQAHALLHEAVTIAATFNYQEGLGMLQPLLALVTLYGGDAGEARRLLDESLRLCIELKDQWFLGQIYRYLAEVALWTGEAEQAAQWLAQSLAYHAAPRRITIYEVERLFVAARLATAQQQYPRAATLFGVAEQAHSHIHSVIAGPMRTLAVAALATVREMLDPTVFAEAFAAGQELSLAEAFATILVPADGVGTRTGA